MSCMFTGSGFAHSAAMPCSEETMLTVSAAIAAPFFAILGLVRIIMVRLCLCVRTFRPSESILPGV